MAKVTIKCGLRALRREAADKGVVLLFARDEQGICEEMASAADWLAVGSEDEATVEPLTIAGRLALSLIATAA